MSLTATNAAGSDGARRIEKLLALKETRSHLEQVVRGARRVEVEGVLAEAGRGSGLRSAPPPAEPKAARSRRPRRRTQSETRLPSGVCG